MSLASDYYRLFGVRSSRDHILLSRHTISPWDTRLCVLGWDIDTVPMTISVALAKMERLRDTLSEWSPDHVAAFEDELRSLIGWLLHLCEVVRPGKCFFRRMVTKSACPPFVRGGRSATHHTPVRRRPHGFT